MENKTSARSESRYKSGSGQLLKRLHLARSEALKPPPKLTLSEWANEYAYLSRENSADTGKYESFKYQDGMMDAVTDPSVQKITVMKSARVGYTKMIDHMVGYHIHQDPAPMIIVQPTEADALDYSEREVAPMLRDTPVLAEIAGDLNKRASKQTLAVRSFRNGASVKFIGANSPNGFRRVTARIVAFDEVDGYPERGAGDDGDQISLGTKRTETFWNSKIILGSTPLVKGVSRIEKSFEESDKRRYHVPCPHCGAKQVLKWENFKWDKDEEGNHLPDTAHFRCEVDGCRIEESSKKAMIDNGEWIAEKSFVGHAGFHIWTAYSLFPKAAWRFLATEWLEVYKDPSRKKSFINLTLGLPHQEVVNVADPEALKARCEPYSWQDLPSDVQFITVGADTHPGRLEVSFVAWGKDEEAWVARHEVLNGDAAHLQVWDDLDKLLAIPCETNDGRKLLPQAVCIDSGGHNSDMVYKFARERKRRRIYAIIGRGNANPASPRMIWPKTASRTKNSGDKPYIIGVDTAKDELSSRLAIMPHEFAPTPRSIHFPDPQHSLSADYFDQLTAEHAVTRKAGSTVTRKWEKKVVGGRNEAWDCLVYALAARMSLPIKLSKKPKPARPAAANDNAPVPVTAPAEEAKPKKRQRERWGAYR